MSRPALLAILALSVAPGLLQAQGTAVYKSRNADGTNVYSQVRVEGAESRNINANDPAKADAEPEAPKSETQLACERARQNLEAYDSGDRLQRDKDGDGVAEDLSAEEIAAEKGMAEQQVTLYCAAEAKPEA